MAAKRERAAPVIHDDGFMINGCMFHVDPKYTPIDAIGQGSYGVVCSVRNTETNEKLAIKKITPMAGDDWDATHTLREIRLMRCLGAHENIISLKDLSMREDKDELYMMMELADTDLHRLIQSSCPLTEGHIRVIMFQILSGVKAMHDNGVLHRDLKPGNLLLNKDCELKITDFGLARMIPRDQSAINTATSTASVVSPMTEYVVTRWYRPPELMLAPNGCYDGAVDMWSVGCILGELASRKPLFPGTDFMDQLSRVFKVVSIPDKDARGYTIEKDALKFLQSLPPAGENAIEKHFKNAPPLAIDLMKKLLCFNPKERLTADQALAHPFFEGVKDEWGEITELKLGHSLEFAFEQQSLPLATLRQYICNEVRAFMEKNESDRKAKKENQATAEPQVDDAGASKTCGSDQQPVVATNQHGDGTKGGLKLINDMRAGCGFTLKGCDFNVPVQYKPLQVLGEGSYGIVCAATDTITKKNVAIKKITPMAGDEWDAKHTLREIRLMRYFGHHPNIASLQNLSTCTEKDELYLMMDLVDTDLHRLIQSKTKLEDAHIAAIMYQLLCGAKVLHENGVLHRDLKPGNILVSKNCDVKITDFGLSRYVPHGGRSNATTSTSASHEKGKDLMTEYVVTRWYRAPEIMLSPNGTYGEAIDMWSIGCIFGELLNRKPMFPGSDFIDQLTRVFSVLPVPAADKRGYHVEGDAQKFLDSLPACSPDAITKLFRKASAEAVSLLRRLLCVNPERRINAKQALAHPYFKSIRAQLGEPPEFQVAKAFDFEFDYHAYPLSHLRQLIQDEVKLLQQDQTTTTTTTTKKKKESTVDPTIVSPAEAKKQSGPHEKEIAKAAAEVRKKPVTASPIATTTSASTAATSANSMHEQQDESDSEVDERAEESKPKSGPTAAFLANKSSEKYEQKPESDDEESVVSAASSGRLQQHGHATASTTATKMHTSVNAVSHQPQATKAPVDPQDDNEDEDQPPEEIIQVERARRPASGKLERPRSATGTAASAAAARRAAAASHRDEETIRTTHRTMSSSSSNNDGLTERWGHPRPATNRTNVSHTTSTSSGATVILKKQTPTSSSSSTAGSARLLSSRSSSLASTTTSSNQNSSSTSLHAMARDSDEKSDAYRHPERAVPSSSSRTAVSSSAATASRGLTSSTSTKEILPEGWVKKIHSKSGREYYYDTLNKVSSWKHPSKMDNIFGNTTTETMRATSSTARRTATATTIHNSTASSSSASSGGPSSGSGKESTLPKDWERRTDPKTGRLYYVNLVTKKAFARLPSSVSASILTTGSSREATTAKKTSTSASTTAAEAALKKKIATVPQTPVFSQTSWQKKTPTATSARSAHADE